MCESKAIRFRRELEFSCRELSAKFSHHGAECGQVHLFELPACGAELFEEAQEMVGSTANRDGGETLDFRKLVVAQQLFGGEGEEEAKMLPRRGQASSLHGK